MSRAVGEGRPYRDHGRTLRDGVALPPVQGQLDHLTTVPLKG